MPDFQVRACVRINYLACVAASTSTLSIFEEARRRALTEAGVVTNW